MKAKSLVPTSGFTISPLTADVCASAGKAWKAAENTIADAIANSITDNNPKLVLLSNFVSLTNADGLLENNPCGTGARKLVPNAVAGNALGSA